MPPGPRPASCTTHVSVAGLDRGPDGFVLMNMGSTLVRIEPRTAEVHPVGKMEQNPLVFLDGDIYVAGAETFRKIVGIPPVTSKE